MALSVSGFPEPLRQPLTELDEPSLLGNSPRLLGLFGKKTESKPLSRQNTEDNIPPSSPSATPRASQLIASSEEQVYLAQMALQSPEPLPPMPIPTPQRQRQISLSRRTPPPVKKQPSTGRLEIGSAPRVVPASPPLRSLPGPPALVVQEWAKTTEPTLASPRPLPAVPNPSPIVESSKNAALRAVNTHTSHRPPASKVLLTAPSRPRAQTTSPHALTVRYQSLAVEPTEPEAPSPPLTTPGKNGVSTNGLARPLPRIPPASAVNPSHHSLLPRRTPRPRAKRPKTSPGSSNSFGSPTRSPFDAIPSSWASRPVDLNPSQPTASTSVSLQVTMPTTRATIPEPKPRSHSRTRRDHSTDASRSRTPSSPVRHSAHSPRRIITNQSITSISSAVTPPSSARYPPGRATGPNVQSSTSPNSSPRLGIAPPPNRFLSDLGVLSTPPSKIEEESGSTYTCDSLSINDGSLHSHPMGRLSSEEHKPQPTLNTSLHQNLTTSPELSPIEAHIDDQDHSSLLSRSPSPMRYARPNSRGSFSDDSSFSPSRSRSRAIRDQLRSYRKSYRGPKSPSRSPSPIRYARRNSLDGLDEPTTSVSPRRHTQPRSYQFDYKAAQESSPFVKAVSVAVGGGKVVSRSGSGKAKRARSKGSPESSRPSRSRSPRRSRLGTPNGSVIDISLPSTTTPSHHEPVRYASSGSSNEDIRLGTSKIRTNQSYVLSDASWNVKGQPTVAEIWKEVNAQKSKNEQQWIGHVYNEAAVVVTTIQPSQEDVARAIPRLRHLQLRN